MENQLNLSQMGLVEMNAAEMEEVEGGGIFGAILGAVVGAIIGAFSDSGTVNGVDTDPILAGAILGATFGSMLPF